jgi:signal transduction histidine kinase/CheY-like chemotaxis protein
VTVASVAGLCDQNSLQTQADVELARRAPAGMLVFGCMVPLLLRSSDFFSFHNATIPLALVVTYGSIAARGWLIWRGGNLFCSHRALWLKLKFGVVLAPIAMWDVFYCVLAIRQGPESWDALLLLLCMICTCFGALHSFTPKLSLLWAYQYTLLAGPALANVFVRSPHHWMVAAVISALLLFMTMQGKVLHAQFWDVLNTQESLKAAMRKAEAASDAKGAFLANMSHEIRTPLNGVLGMIAVMLESELPDEQHKQLQLAMQSGLLLKDILNDVLDFSKIEAGKVELEVEDFDLKTTLEEVVGLMTTTARQRGLDLRLDYPSGIRAWFRGDAGKIRQIALNFVGNALKFTAKGSITVLVATESACPGEVRVKIAVRDTGIGISSEQQVRLFEKFSQADDTTTRRYGGTGLGLAICKRLAVLMRGEVGVISNAGAGSTFWVRIPLVPVTPPALSAAPATGDTSARRAWRGKVLVVEDNAINQTVIVHLLERRGLFVDTATSGRDALKTVSKIRYSLIFMDCQMPEMDGYQATRAIRECEELQSLPRTPIVAMTANVMAGDRERCLRAGMDDYIGKPLRVDELDRTLSRWIGPSGPVNEAVPAGPEAVDP